MIYVASKLEVYFCADHFVVTRKWGKPSVYRVCYIQFLSKKFFYDKMDLKFFYLHETISYDKYNKYKLHIVP